MVAVFVGPGNRDDSWVRRWILNDPGTLIDIADRRDENDVRLFCREHRGGVIVVRTAPGRMTSI